MPPRPDSSTIIILMHLWRNAWRFCASKWHGQRALQQAYAKGEEINKEQLKMLAVKALWGVACMKKIENFKWQMIDEQGRPSTEFKTNVKLKQKDTQDFPLSLRQILTKPELVDASLVARLKRHQLWEAGHQAAAQEIFNMFKVDKGTAIDRNYFNQGRVAHALNESRTLTFNPNWIVGSTIFEECSFRQRVKTLFHGPVGTSKTMHFMLMNLLSRPMSLYRYLTAKMPGTLTQEEIDQIQMPHKAFIFYYSLAKKGRSPLQYFQILKSTLLEEFAELKNELNSTSQVPLAWVRTVLSQYSKSIVMVSLIDQYDFYLQTVERMKEADDSNNKDTRQLFKKEQAFLSQLLYTLETAGIPWYNSARSINNHLAKFISNRNLYDISYHTPEQRLAVDYTQRARTVQGQLDITHMLWFTIEKWLHASIEDLADFRSSLLNTLYSFKPWPNWITPLWIKMNQEPLFKMNEDLKKAYHSLSSKQQKEVLLKQKVVEYVKALLKEGLQDLKHKAESWLFEGSSDTINDKVSFLIQVIKIVQKRRHRLQQTVVKQLQAAKIKVSDKQQFEEQQARIRSKEGFMTIEKLQMGEKLEKAAMKYQKDTGHQLFQIQVKDGSAHKITLNISSYDFIELVLPVLMRILGKKTINDFVISPSNQTRILSLLKNVCHESQDFEDQKEDIIDEQQRKLQRILSWKPMNSQNS